MALSIKSDEADALARELSRLTGESLTTTVTESLRQRLDLERRIRGDAVGTAIAKAQAEIRKLPRLDDRTDDEILGYNDHGHFD
jgi:antitoxin VapB